MIPQFILVFLQCWALQAGSASDPVTHVQFPEFRVSIHGFVLEEDTGGGVVTAGDSVVLLPDLGETIEGRKITVSSGALAGITIEQSYETSVVIADEGPHCDLLSWKHYYGPWKPLAREGDSSFTAVAYTPEERGRFPAVQVSELKKEVRQYCGEGWYRLIRAIRSVGENPSDVGISRYFLRISGTRKADGKKITKKIVIEQPMGC